MATFRVGVGSFNIQDGAVGFGTDTDGLGNLKVKGVTKTTDIKVSGASTLTRYSGFAADNINQIENIILTSEVGTIGDIVVGVGTSVIISSASTVTVGTVESVSIGTHFSLPVGGIEERGDNFIEGMMRFNTDLNTMEFYNGNEWRQFTYISDVQNSPSSRGRGVFGGGFDGPSPFTNAALMHMIEISTLGNSEFFGDLTQQRRNPGGRVSDGTRGLILGGYHEPVGRDTIDYCTIASAGDFVDFGNLTTATYAIANGGVSSSTRGVVGGGVDPSPAYVNVMQYVQIQTIGNALDFGDLTTTIVHGQAVNSQTKGLFCGGMNPGLGTRIQSITISSTGNAVDIADLQQGRFYGAGVSNGVRGVVGGGFIVSPMASNGMGSSLEFVTIASDGNAVVFGDLTQARGKMASAETHTRGVFIGSDSGNPSTNTYTNVMDFINIASAGNAQDFGDATNDGNHQLAGFSDSHGGLGGY